MRKFLEKLANFDFPSILFLPLETVRGEQPLKSVDDKGGNI